MDLLRRRHEIQYSAVGMPVVSNALEVDSFISMRPEFSFSRFVIFNSFLRPQAFLWLLKFPPVAVENIKKGGAMTCLDCKGKARFLKASLTDLFRPQQRLLEEV
jgi:hypothetical protein